jgi:hypothetical protein
VERNEEEFIYQKRFNESRLHRWLVGFRGLRKMRQQKPDKLPSSLLNRPITNHAATIFAIAIAFTCIANHTVTAQEILLDSFENVSGWKEIASDGVDIKILKSNGYCGSGMQMQFEFKGGAGYAIAQKKFEIDLPENYKFTFYLRADAPVNNFEFKLLDSSDDVYWIKKVNYNYPRDWQKIAIKKRHLAFAWGPAGGGDIKKVDRVEFVASAGTGGRGSIYIDEFKVEPISEPAAYAWRPVVSASSEMPGYQANFALDSSQATSWRSMEDNEQQWFLIEFQKSIEFGGLVIDWDKKRYAKQFNVLTSFDGKRWDTVYVAKNCSGDRSYIFTQEGEGSFIKLELDKSASKRGYSISNVEIKPSDFSASINSFFYQVARDKPKGYYPKYLSREQSYWTVVGASGDNKKALINEEGAVEIDKSSFSLEPFLFLRDSLITWKNVQVSQGLEKGYLPIPSVIWRYVGLELTVKAFSYGVKGESSLIICYQIRNDGVERTRGKFFVAIRPFQVLPPWQELSITGGATSIKEIGYGGEAVFVNRDKEVFSLVKADHFGCVEFDAGDITEYLRIGKVPPQSKVRDHFGYASGALLYRLDLVPGGVKEVCLVVPFHGKKSLNVEKMKENNARSFVRQKLEQTIAFWESKLNNVELHLPPAADKMVNAFKSSIAYMLINRNGYAIHPGSRTYDRSWIRDGSMISAALLRTGNFQDVREYINWYAGFQYPNGKIPCVVDSRGADPVPEHDSHGEFIYAVGEYYRFTGDIQFLKDRLANVAKAFDYIEMLRNQRITDTYEFGNDEQKACYGLVPESISHEGYSAKPMHSYWDDFFAMKGLKDAVTIANALGESGLEKRFMVLRDEFKKSLYSSMRLAISAKGINYIPGCVELGDFDATSTAIGIFPCGELGDIPHPQLTQPSDNYYEFFRQRKNGSLQWENYTPYETRIVGAFVHLDERKRAHELLDFLFLDQRPAGWNHWAEVVWRERTNPRFVGDMPHTWIASDYINSIRSMFVYEREKDSALVIGSGLLEDWLESQDGVTIKRFPTYYGNIGYTVRKTGRSVGFQFSGDVRHFKIILKSPSSEPIKRVSVDGLDISSFDSNEVFLDRFPGQVILYY